MKITCFRKHGNGKDIGHLYTVCSVLQLKYVYVNW